MLQNSLKRDECPSDSMNIWLNIKSSVNGLSIASFIFIHTTHTCIIRILIKAIEHARASDYGLFVDDPIQLRHAHTATCCSFVRNVRSQCQASSTTDYFIQQNAMRFQFIIIIIIVYLSSLTLFLLCVFVCVSDCLVHGSRICCSCGTCASRELHAVNYMV